MLDEIEIIAIAGDGGNGAVSFRRERFIPRGGPDGGDGGRGGNVMVEADESTLVLDKLRRSKTVRAASGAAGGPQKRHGKNGGHVAVKVPVGTIVWERGGEKIADLDRAGKRVVIARGGSGGKGNARMATASRRAPRIAERGLPGERRTLKLELRLLAEVGLVGLPNAGKSSLLQAVSQARPKVGAYPFTTLEPHLGIAEIGYETVVVADIPGLIEGAHLGAGLGTRFLRHIGRTSVLVHVVDIESNDLVGDINTVRDELQAFGEGLASKPRLVALNKIDKIDLPDGAERRGESERLLRKRGLHVFAISALTGEGVPELLSAVFDAVREERAAESGKQGVELPTVELPRGPEMEVVKQRDRFLVKGRRAEEAVLRLGVESDEARAELARRLRRAGVYRALQKAGVEDGDRVLIAGEELQWPL